MKDRNGARVAGQNEDGGNDKIEKGRERIKIEKGKRGKQKGISRKFYGRGKLRAEQPASVSSTSCKSFVEIPKVSSLSSTESRAGGSLLDVAVGLMR